MTASAIPAAASVLATPSAYTNENRLHSDLARLRAEAPVVWVEAADYRPFWGVTKHADVQHISRDNELFTNSPRPVLVRASRESKLVGSSVNSLIHMDGAQHRAIRAIAADWFRPKAMRALGERVALLARRHVDQMYQLGGACDFAADVAVNYPLYVIMSLLGIPEADFTRMLTLTQELFGVDDEDAEDAERRELTDDGHLPALLDMFEYFTALTRARRENPTEDLGSVIANARVDGEFLSDIDVLSYYLVIATAGHDTTSATIAGGLAALLEFPDQREKLTADLDLMPIAVEEMIRWVTPVKAFMRTASAATTLRGVDIAAGDSILLSYVSANRDEDAFDDPFRFDISRKPNKHIAFGQGAHFCLGAALARMEISAFFTELLPRTKSIELAGAPQLTATSFVGGLKHLPVRYSLKQGL